MMLRHGKMVKYDETRQIIQAPRMDYTKALVSVRSIKHKEKTPATSPVLQVKNVTAAYGGYVKVLQDVSVDVHPGQTLAVVIESGSGKSTLARVITGLLPPMSGRHRFRRPHAHAEARQPLQGRSARVADDLPDGRRGDEPAPDR
ncbi:ATP-binding cassette domain-containing protein, partial [Mesorhizobium sp. M7A.F.Ca.MR.148.00.0.0]|uniref:ATP-binding cassette domain-containing protein n=1 Tax=Mesorhizobium sp. M7A.F.Ca.MR.148.00.0.0 TaxID=2496775 RepID=UPI000FCCAD3B